VVPFFSQGFFTHIIRPMRIMAAELRSERPPATIMLFLAREEAQLQRRFARARRNEPCPCGWGRKFENYCGRRGSPSGLLTRG